MRAEQKSVLDTLDRVAIVTAAIFILSAVILAVLVIVLAQVIR